MAALVLTELRSRHPDHPAAAWTESRPGPLEDTLWTDEPAQQVLECLNFTLYERLQLLEDEAPESPDGAEDEELHGVVSCCRKKMVNFKLATFF